MGVPGSQGGVQGVPGVKGLTKGLLVGQGGRLGGPRGPRKIPRGSNMVTGDVYEHWVPGGCLRVPRGSR